MKKFIREFATLPNYFEDDGITYRISIQSDLDKNNMSIDIEIDSVPENHPEFSNWVHYNSIYLRHNENIFQGYLFSSSDFENEKGGLNAICEVITFAFENRYDGIMNYFKQNNKIYKKFENEFNLDMMMKMLNDRVIK